jgi:hypothetical protein
MFTCVIPWHGQEAVYHREQSLLRYCVEARLHIDFGKIQRAIPKILLDKRLLESSQFRKHVANRKQRRSKPLGIKQLQKSAHVIKPNMFAQLY